VRLPPGTSPETAVSYGMLCLMTAAVLTAAAGGIATDLMGGRRKVLVYMAGGIMSVSCMAVVFLEREMHVTLVLLTIFGLGFGCYLVRAAAPCLPSTQRRGAPVRPGSASSAARQRCPQVPTRALTQQRAPCASRVLRVHRPSRPCPP
jgi:MFS family permease